MAHIRVNGVRLLVASLILLSTVLTQIRPADGQNAPDCFATPPKITASGYSSTVQTPAACEELAKILMATDQKDIAWIPGAGLNEILSLTEGGFTSDAYVLRFRVSQRFNQLFAGPYELVRFGNDEARARSGSWWTTLESVTTSNGNLVTSGNIETRLALPQSSVPRVVAYASGVEVGTVGYFGIVAPAFGRSGGAVQFWFPSEPVYTETVKPL